MTEKQNEESKTVAKKERSSAYPAIPLGEAVEYSKKLIAAYPRSHFDRASAAVSMGYATLSGASAPKIAALVHYGLLARKGNAYKNSELAERILHYTTEDEKTDAILEAVKQPKLFESLVNEYSGSAVPSTLNNILVRQYGISRKVSDSVVQTFKDSLEFAGLYANGVVSTDASREVEAQTDGSANESGPRNSGQHEKHKQERQTQSGMLDVELPSGLILSYSKALAFAFSIGTFGKQIGDLDAAVQKELNKNASGDPTKNDAPSAE